MGASSRFGFSGGGYAYEPVGAAEALEGVRVPIWSTKCLTARWFGPAPPLVEADLAPVGTDRLAGTVTNRLDVPLEDAILAFGKQVYLLGTIAAGADASGSSWRRTGSLSGYLKDSGQGRRARQPYGNAGLPDQPAPTCCSRLMFHDSRARPRPRPPAGEQPAPLPRPDRPARPRPADARRPDRPPGDPARPGQRPSAPADRPDDDAPRDPAAAKPRRRARRRRPTRQRPDRPTDDRPIAPHDPTVANRRPEARPR